MESSVYKVKTSIFEGPLDLLLSLIEKRKLFINDLSLAEVTDDYLSYIKDREDMSKGELSNFIVIAATLILIKSKSLLPGIELEDEEKESIEELERRLKIYKVIQEVGREIQKKFGKKIVFGRPESEFSESVFAPGKEITKEKMNELAEGLIGRIPKDEKLPKVEVVKVINIEEMIEKLIERVQSNINFSFEEFSGKSGGTPKEKKVYAIVGFLAMLELVRQGLVDVIQEKDFEDIQLMKTQEHENTRT